MFRPLATLFSLVSLAVGVDVHGAEVARAQMDSSPTTHPVYVASQPREPITLARVKNALPQFETLVNDTLLRTQVPGLAIAIVYEDEVIYLQGFGVREVNQPEAVDIDTLFQLASVSKPIASTVMAALVSDGTIQWDDPIQRHDPNFAMNESFVSQSVTLRDMFSHRSGLPVYGGDRLEDIGFSQAEVIRRLRFLPLDNRFRATYAYTNFGLTAAAVAAAKSRGQSWEDLSRTRLYQPLGMTRTSSRHADFLADPNRVKNHRQRGDRWVVSPEQRNPDAQTPAGGVSSSIRDLAQWMRLQLNQGQFQGRQIMTADALAETHRPQMISQAPANPSQDRAGFYGLGWNVSYPTSDAVRLSHSGGFLLGAATVVVLVPQEKLGIAVLSNAAPIGVPEALAASFLDIVNEGQPQQDYVALFADLFKILFAPPYGEGRTYTPPDNALPAKPGDRYVGIYKNDYVGPIAVEKMNGDLTLYLGPNRMAFPLRHYSGNTFSYQPTGENAYGPSAVTFRFALESQPASHVTIENLDVYGQGTFARQP
ncbi:serine hydrolase [Candidatus Synechococcus calcipolaris G9]|uniref:Serine hydrolase n=1 Tax=Candidatus Synechococcus calcipolaris G9 TaxID=1497997 RepID=A0ABT6EWH8_9SYNE|nr:serine hydrolase [Candidatus Synechococcus calcipolaris]MDG2989722.1 serine hydrolase [Candidatus Synechococcus calcipolaris G9]